MWRSISRHWFLWLLAICLGIGFGFPAALSPIANTSMVRTGTVVMVMFLMGWTLQPSSVVRCVRQPVASLLAIAINVAVVPLLAWPALWLLPADLAGGLIVASVVPCTLASASVWTRAGGGDDAVAMVVTVVTNLLCFIVAPLEVWFLLGRQVETDLAAQMQGLLLQVVLPLIAGQLLRSAGTSRFADRCVISISNLAQVGVLWMVLLGTVISAERMAADAIDSALPIVAVAGFAWGVHVTAVAVGLVAAAFAGVDRPRRIAIAISGSQKTLVVGLQLALGCGVSVLPMILYHVGQLLIDTLLVRFWRHVENQ